MTFTRIQMNQNQSLNMAPTWYVHKKMRLRITLREALQTDPHSQLEKKPVNNKHSCDKSDQKNAALVTAPLQCRRRRRPKHHRRGYGTPPALPNAHSRQKIHPLNWRYSLLTQPSARLRTQHKIEAAVIVESPVLSKLTSSIVIASMKI